MRRTVCLQGNPARVVELRLGVACRHRRAVHGLRCGLPRVIAAVRFFKELHPSARDQEDLG